MTFTIKRWQKDIKTMRLIGFHANQKKIEKERLVL
jgi:hypothetical protein